MANLTALLRRIKLRQQLPPPRGRRRARVAAGLSQRDVARAIEVAPATIALWESGQRNPRPDLLVRYLRLLNAISKAS